MASSDGVSAHFRLVANVAAQFRRNEGLNLPWLPTLARTAPLTPRGAINLFLVRASERSPENITTLNEVRALHGGFEHLFQVSERLPICFEIVSVQHLTSGWWTLMQHGT
jgi:hypothetical protein